MLARLKAVETVLNAKAHGLNNAHDIFVTYVSRHDIRVCRNDDAVNDFIRDIQQGGGAAAAAAAAAAEPVTAAAENYYFVQPFTQGTTIGFKMQLQTPVAEERGGDEDDEAALRVPPPITVGWTVRKNEDGSVVSRAIKPHTGDIDATRTSINISGTTHNFPSAAYIQWAITMLENYKSANGGYPTIIRGGWHPQFVEAALLYCALKGHAIENLTEHHKNFKPDAAGARIQAFSQLLGKGFKEESRAVDEAAAVETSPATAQLRFFSEFRSRREVKEYKPPPTAAP